MKERDREGRAAPGAGGTGAGGWIARIAVLVLLVAGVVSLVPPLRARLFEAVPGESEQTEDAGVVEGAEQPVDTTALELLPAPDTVRLDSLDVRFSRFEFELLANQRYGVVRVRVEDRAAAVVEIHTRTGLERFFELPTGVRVFNRPGSVADYELVLPRKVRTVRLTMAGRELALYGTLAPENADRTFTLADYAQ